MLRTGIRHAVRYALILAACCGFATASAAQQVVYSSADGATQIAGKFVAFDGRAVTLFAQTGLLSFRADGLTYAGSGCPDLVNYVPRLRLIGADRMAHGLMPALIDVYARDNGWSVVETDAGFRLVADDGQEKFRISLEVAEPERAFDRFITHEADALMSLRELRPGEIDRGYAAGLGRLTLARQARIIALDALVPVASPRSGVTSISLADLTQALSGRAPGFDVILSREIDGQIQGFEDRFMTPFDRSIGPVRRVDTDVAEAVAQSETGLSVLPYGLTGNTQPLTVSGPCGLDSSAQFMSLKTEDYPLTFPMFLYLPQRAQHPMVEDFLTWLRSASAQLVIRRAGFVDLAAVPIPLADQGDRLAIAILNAGAEVSLDELQRMVHTLSSRVRMSTTFRFEPGSTRLDGQSRSNVMQLAQAVRDGRFAGQEVMFIGFSDGMGPADANRDLSAARAEAVLRDVRRALGERVPDTVTFTVDAFGEALSMACDESVWGQQTNRRVEVWVRRLD